MQTTHNIILKDVQEEHAAQRKAMVIANQMANE